MRVDPTPRRLACLLALAACAADDTDDPAAAAAFSRPANPACAAMDRPAPPGGVRVARAFPGLALSGLIHAVKAPGDDTHWVAIEQDGDVWRFEDRDDVTEKAQVLDLSVVCCGEMGLLGIAYDPDFARSGAVYLSYTLGSSSTPTSRISRFTSTDGGLTLDPTTEEVLLELAQPYANHNGGHLAFGPDGSLYAGFGDGGGGGDPLEAGQRLDTWLGKMLRLDVSGPDLVPDDNPFVDTPGARPEIWAYGLRNPWRFSFDRETGDLWAGDVGQGQWEEVDRIVRGGNYGWDDKEGTHCYEAASPCEGQGWIDPVAEYDHSVGRSITGGFVYRGSAIPGLQGTFVYGDFSTGALFGVAPDLVNGDWSATELIATTGVNISSFAEDGDGELYLLHYYGGFYKLVPEGDPVANPFPVHLAATGCADAADPRLPAAGLVAYDLAHPFWSDGAQKARWLAIPDGEAITVGDDGHLTLPVGSVVRKDFDRAGARLETRLFVHHPDGWAGYTWRWNDDQTDALWVPAGATDADAPGGPWRWPNGGECLGCHTDAAGRTLGLSATQLDVGLPGEFAPENQLDAWLRTGLLVGDPPRGALPAIDDPAASVEDRARTWLDVNCAMCHRPGAPAGGAPDLRRATPIADTGLCDTIPGRGDLGVPDARLVAPGAPDRSVLLARIGAMGAYEMPPGRLAVDPDGETLIRAWITEGAGCP